MGAKPDRAEIAKRARFTSTRSRSDAPMSKCAQSNPAVNYLSAGEPFDGFQEPQTSIQQHQDYAEGFYDAAEGAPLHYGMTREYRSGWIALHRARRLLRRIEQTK